MLLQHENLIDFTPHKFCWLLRSDIITTHALGDGLTALSYFLIPIILIYTTRKFRLNWNLTFVFSVYATFILLCGTTHIFDVIMIWNVNEGILLWDGYLRMATGFFSLFSVAVTFWASRTFLSLVWQLFKVSNRITRERIQLGRATEGAIQEFNDLLSKAKDYLQRKEVVE